MLFDLPSRKFYIFDLVIWPQDIFLLTFLLFGATMALFFMTTLAGRVFCGYMCFQTVWTDLFIYVEKLVEGDRAKRINLERSPLTVNKVLKKAIKHTIWLLIGVATGGAFVFYFADAPTLFMQFVHGTAPGPAWFTLGFLTLTTYVFAGFAREQVCIYMCPYARFQGVMFDRDTLIVAYDENRGEPRIANRREREGSGERAGDCIDCGACVRVCPTGIDIRDGQQYQCITCAACIDACDEVMDALKKPHGLVRYTSLSALEGNPLRLLRGRVFLYGGLLALVAAGIAGYLMERSPVDLNVIRNRKPVYIQLSSGGIQNNYTARVLNKTAQPQRYTLTLEGLPGATLCVAAVDETDLDGHPVLEVGPGEVVPFTVYVRQPRETVASGTVPVTFQVRAEAATGGSNRYDSKFMRP